MASDSLKWMLPARFWALTVPIFLCLALAENVGLLAPLTQVGVRLNPTLSTVTFQVTDALFTPWKIIRSSYYSYKLVQNLEQRIAEMQTQTAEISQLRQENMFLRQAVATSSIQPPPPTQRWVSPVVRYLPPLVAIPPQLSPRSGSAVVVNGVFLGRVSTVENGAVNVRLIQESISQPVVAQVQTTNIMGVVRPQGQQLLFTDFPPDSDIPIDSVIVTSQQVGVPANLAIGKVQQVKVDENRQEPVAVLTPLAVFYDFPYVEIWQ